MRSKPRNRSHGHEFLVVLTGGIASGKSIGSDQFEQLGVPIIVTDIIVKQLVGPGKPALDRMIEQSGLDYLQAAGQLDQPMSIWTIFSDDQARRPLEKVLHLSIRSEALAWAREVNYPYYIFGVSLRTPKSPFISPDEVLVVEVDEVTQIKRLVVRDSISSAVARKILLAQPNRQERLSVADDVINNEGDLYELQRKVSYMRRKYLSPSRRNGVNV